MHAKLWPRFEYHFYPQILRTNHQINVEARVYLTVQNIFVLISSLDLNVLDIAYELGLGVVLEGSRARLFQDSAMEVIVISPSSVTGAKYKHCVIACDDLELFCQGFLFAQNDGPLELCLSKITIGITMRNLSGFAIPLPEIAQMKLLNPFIKLHSLRKLTIHGPESSMNQDFYTEVATQATRKAPTIGEVFEMVRPLIEEGNEAYRNHKPLLAISKYRYAKQLIEIGWDGEDEEDRDFMNVNFRVTSGLSALHFKLGEWADAHLWTQKALYTVRAAAEVQSFSSVPKRGSLGWAKLKYRSALARMQMNKIKGAAHELAVLYEEVDHEIDSDEELLALKEYVHGNVSYVGSFYEHKRRLMEVMPRTQDPRELEKVLNAIAL